MTPDFHNFGKLLGVYTPVVWHLWAWLFVILATLIFLIFGLVGVFIGITNASSGMLPGASLCLGSSALTLIFFFFMLSRDFHKWQTTKTVVLKIYEKGLTYESQGYLETCRWDEIYDIKQETLEIPQGRHKRPRRVEVVQSITKKDRTVIAFTRALNLEKITAVIRQMVNIPT